MKIDPILLSVYARTFKAITDEMSISMEQTTRSPILCEAKDFVTGLYDADGRMLEQTENLPILAFSLAPVCKHIRELFGGDIHEGDVIFHNDVFSSATRTTTSPCSSRSSSRASSSAWTAVKGHQADIGGAVRRRLQPERDRGLAGGAAHPAGQGLSSAASCARTSGTSSSPTCGCDIVQHDMQAEIGACTVGERRLARAARASTASSSFDGAQAGAVRRDAAHDGSRDRADPRRQLHAAKATSTTTAATRARSSRSASTSRSRTSADPFDYSRTDAQTNGFVNGTFTSSASATILTLLQMVNPDIPHNEGMVDADRDRDPRGHDPQRRLSRRRPPSATTSARPTPTPSSARWRRCMPDRVTAGWNDLLCVADHRHRPARTSEKYVDIGFMGLKGGSGAHAAAATATTTSA